MNLHIPIILLSSWICCDLVSSNTIPMMMSNNHPNHRQQSFNNFNNIHNSIHSHLNQRTARGLLSALSGLGNVATGSNLLVSKDPDDDDLPNAVSSSSLSNPSKSKPYAFNDVEMTAIQAMISLRNIIGDLLHKVGVNIPTSIASLITRSENEKNINPTSLLATGGESGTSSLISSATSKVNAMLLLRGLALSLPLLIPMANQIRRMSNDNGVVMPSLTPGTSLPSMVPSVPQFFPQFDPYGYDRALHRRRGKRSLRSTTSVSALLLPKLLSTPINRLLRYEEQKQLLRFLREIEEIYGNNNNNNHHHHHHNHHHHRK